MKPKRRQAAGRVRRIVLGEGWYRTASADRSLVWRDAADKAQKPGGSSIKAEKHYITLYRSDEWRRGVAVQARLVLEVLPKQQPKRKAARRAKA